jgi:hypothetical protein
MTKIDGNEGIWEMAAVEKMEMRKKGTCRVAHAISF